MARSVPVVAPVRLVAAISASDLPRVAGGGAAACLTGAWARRSVTSIRFDPTFQNPSLPFASASSSEPISSASSNANPPVSAVPCGVDGSIGVGAKMSPPWSDGWSINGCARVNDATYRFDHEGGVVVRRRLALTLLMLLLEIKGGEPIDGGSALAGQQVDLGLRRQVRLWQGLESGPRPR